MDMEYDSGMRLASESGYCLPFIGKAETVRLLRAYGAQEDGTFNHGIDLAGNGYSLRAVASGQVSAVGARRDCGTYIAVAYGDYEVSYGFLGAVLAGCGRKVRAGDAVAVSGDRVRIEVSHRGREISPCDFVAMLIGNGAVAGEDAPPGSAGFPDFDTLNMDIPTRYDESRDDVVALMERFLPDYLKAVSDGAYRIPAAFELTLRNVFSWAAARKFLFETLPSMTNPLGLGERSRPLIAKVQNDLIGDFLAYMALEHGVFLPGSGSDDKKKLSTGP